MNTNYTRGLSVLGLLLAMTARTQANDIVDFLRAVNGIPEQRHAPPVYQPAGHHDHGTGYGGHELSSRDLYKQSMQRAEGHAAYGSDGHHPLYDRFDQDQYGRDQLGRNQFDLHNRVDLRDHSAVRPGYSRSEYNPRSYSRSGYGRSGAQIRFRVSTNGSRSSAYGEPLYIPSQQPEILPPVESYPPVQSYPSVPVLPHQLGEIVDCRVRLETCERIEDECNIAPNAVPVVVAVRDPHMCVHETQERLVYVQVFVPPCPLRGLTISPCRTRVSMDFGQYQVDIKSRDGVVVVDYDN